MAGGLWPCELTFGSNFSLFSQNLHVSVYGFSKKMYNGFGNKPSLYLLSKNDCTHQKVLSIMSYPAIYICVFISIKRTAWQYPIKLCSWVGLLVKIWNWLEKVSQTYRMYYLQFYIQLLLIHTKSFYWPSNLLRSQKGHLKWINQHMSEPWDPDMWTLIFQCGIHETCPYRVK